MNRIEELEDLLRSAHAIAARKGEGTAWDRFADRCSALGIGSVTPKTFRVLEGDPLEANPANERARKAVEGLCAVFEQICDAAGIDIEETTITARRRDDGSEIAGATLKQIMDRARESVGI